MHDCDPGDVSHAHTRLAIGDIIGGIGIASAVSGGVVLVLGPGRPAPAAAVQPVSGGLVWVLRGRFRGGRDARVGSPSTRSPALRLIS